MVKKQNKTKYKTKKCEITEEKFKWSIIVLYPLIVIGNIFLLTLFFIASFIPVINAVTYYHLNNFKEEEEDQVDITKVLTKNVTKTIKIKCK